MERRRFARTGRDVAVIGQGTWELDKGDCRAAVTALRRGDAEPVIAQAIASRRDEVFLVSKVLPEHATRKGAIQACERSLRRLRTDRLDSYLLHWAGEHPLEDTIAAFEELQQAGKILSWGVSNFDVHELEAARAIAGDGQIACNQVLYHLEQRGIAHAVLPWCANHGVAVVAYTTPFGAWRAPPRRVASRPNRCVTRSPPKRPTTMPAAIAT